MKITAVKTYKFSVATGQAIADPHTGESVSSASKAWLFCKLETDAGIDGWGEGSGEWLVSMVETALQEISPLLIGRDPLRIAALTDDITDRLPWKGGPVLGTAIAAVNIALHDIAGKAWSVPIHTLLGGARRGQMRVYRGGRMTVAAEAADDARELQRLGFSGVKGNPLEERRWPMDEAAIANSTAAVAAIREAAGPGFSIMLDTHGSPQPELSVQFAKCVAPYDPLFLEEPCKVGSVDALLQVSRNSPVPIATGEKLFLLRDFLPLIERRACAFLQPDIGHCFGITNLMKIAAHAEEQQMLMAPHIGVGGILYVASLHADAAMPNFLIQETPRIEVLDSYFEHDLAVRDGYVNLPQNAGLGISVKEADLAKLPYEPMPFRQYRHEDGSWKGW